MKDYLHWVCAVEFLPRNLIMDGRFNENKTVLYQEIVVLAS